MDIEQQVDLEIEHAHLRGTIAAHKVMLHVMSEYINNMILSIDKMLEETKVK